MICDIIKENSISDKGGHIMGLFNWKSKDKFDIRKTKEDYENKNTVPLLENGKGAFCRFVIDAEDVPGVYLWIVDGEIIYIGETKNLRKRFNTGYGNISPRNCYLGGQSTNCKMNKVVLEYFEAGKQIKLYFLKTDDYKRVELELLSKISTRYNVKDN